MANSTSHTLPYPILNARYTVPLTFRVAAGTLTDPTTPDTEISTDGGASFSDTAEEITTGGGNGCGYLTLTGAETNNSVLFIAGKSANDLTTPAIIQPRRLAIVGSGTLSAGSAGGGTLGTLLAYDVTGCFIRTTGGTGGGGTGGANNQARRIITYNTSTGAFTVSPNWETTPSTDTTYDVLLPEGVTLGMLWALNPETPGRTAVVDANGLIDANAVKVGPSGSGTAQTAKDLGAINVTNLNTLSSHDPGATLGTSTYAGADTAGTTTLLTRITGAVPSAADIKTAIEADGSKLDHLWEMTEDDAGTRRLTTNALEQAPTGGSAPTADAIADEVETRMLNANLKEINDTAILGTGTQVADAFTSFFNVASPTGTVNSLPAAVPGASNGVFIAGSNAATTLATWTVTGATTFTGNIAAQAGLYISQSASNAPGLWITGNGTGEAARLAGGNTVGTSAVSIVAAASSGYGVSIGGVSGLGTNLASLVVGGSTTLTGAVTSTHASNDIRGVKISGTLTTLDAVWAKIQNWLRLGFRKDAAVAADHATELSEINADGGSGGGTFDNTTDATEAIRDSALTQTQVTGGAYALNSSSFAFNAALDLTTTQKASVTDAVPRKVKKNTALADFQFVMLDSVTKLPAAGKTVTVERNIDDADSFVAGTLSAVSEVGNGVYRVSFAAADLNGNIIVLRATATGCDPTIERILTTS